MPLFEALFLETGNRSPSLGRSEAFEPVLEEMFPFEDFQSVAGVALPIGDEIDVSPRPEFPREGLQKTGLEESALVMLLLRPRVGKEDMDPLEASFGDHLPGDLLGISFDDPYISEAPFVDYTQEISNPRFEDLDSEIIDIGSILGDPGGCRPVAETDLEDHRIPVSEKDGEIEGRVRNGCTVDFPEVMVSPLLPLAHSPAANYVAPDGTPPGVPPAARIIAQNGL